LLGLTAWTVVDPIVLSLNTAWRFNRPRRDGDDRLDPGNLLVVSPSVSFAANDRISLSGGVQWLRQAADRRNRQRLGFTQTTTDIILGLGYGLADQGSLNFTISANASGRNGADLRLNWLKPL
jgi:hypothetical protein